MNDPERLINGHASGLSARLLRAGAAEAPSGRSLERTLAALGAAATTLGSAGAAGALGAASSGKVASLTLLGLAKWAGAGLAGGALVSMVAHVAAPAPPPESASSAPRVALAAPASPERAAEPKPVLPAPAAEPSASIESPRSVPVAESPGARPDEPTFAPLAAEVSFVDRGRAAFQRGEAGAALAALATYERTYPERRLLPEVLYLRMEALAASGDDARARELARRIVREFSRSPHRARAAALLGAP
jgi:hypothetical protein